MFRRSSWSYLLPLLICAASLQPVLTSLYPSSSLTINSGEGFVVRLSLGTTSPISECTLDYNSRDVYYLSEGDIHVTPTFETIESLSASECGARVKNVSNLSPAIWPLQAKFQDESINWVTDTLRLSILHSIADPDLVRVHGAAGHFGTLACPGEESEQRYCEITDPSNKISQSCNVKVKYPPIESGASKYICRVWFWGRIDAVMTEMHVSAEPTPPKVVTRVIDNPNHVILSCQILGESLSVCRADLRQNQFLIMDGLQGRRYSVRDTRLSDGLCQFEIEKPLAANETGHWRIHAKLSSSAWTGCIFDLSADQAEADQEYEDFKASLASVIALQSPNSFDSVSCGGGPYPLDYCYLKTPANEIVQPTGNEMKLFSQYGLCTFTVSSLAGRYTCVFNARDQSAGDLYQHYDLTFSDYYTYVEASATEVQVGPSDRLLLHCYALKDYSINACIFVAPNGDLFPLPNSSFSNDRFAYHGRGFVEGECGIEIFQVDYESHLGEWTCSLNLIDYQQVSETIVVKGNNELSTGALAGIVVGGSVLLLAAAALGFICYRHHRRRLRRRQADELPTTTMATSQEPFSVPL